MSKKYVPPNRRTKTEADKLAERKERFNKPQKLEPGFVSRGEENELQKDKNARKAYFDSIKKMDREKPDPILNSLRKLREAMLHLPWDEFTKEVYMFSFEFGASIGKYQTYVPCGQSLLRSSLLTKKETKEVAAIMTLHISHCNNDCSRAWSLFFRYFTRDDPLHAVLEAWTLDDYVKWTELLRSEKDSPRKHIMELGLNRMMHHMVHCLTVSYFTMAAADMATLIDSDVDSFIKEYKTGWTVDNGIITLRRRK